jgi:hypothetical protein
LPSRRQFIKVGIAGAALLAAVRYLDRAHAAPVDAYRVLDESGAIVIRALIPVVLAGSLPVEEAAQERAIADLLAAFDRALSGLAPAVQEEMAELFSVLAFAPSRLAFTGLWAPLDKTPRAEIKAFLMRWRHSRFNMQRAGYEALTQLIQASWYDNPSSWRAIGYPGPPDIKA